ncbi:type II toxin-antitoxin system RelE/ParE family toxin [Thiospirochaeta perfilievii]|uniref:Type II toxin-antitoxin system RelE/ParE family toxin n=1 Tax=Thiospirochaeta perfilievii TaxID=252967 RepID=A0A5C1QEF0_9SPIO|nr:type II toxin-antitoxin system RelE/ParE family toxin [Thiospirochaeta perfilievii]QEN05440.1 type II toxin-antitoxin system RelE/ParE family toxin [Thiospirochaeta perfilievii]
MKYQILSPAKQELINSIEYYNTKVENLGYKFLLSFEDTVSRILLNPDAWQPLSKNTRRCPLKSFPYGVIYQIDGSCIYIISIMNLKRKPDYWYKLINDNNFNSL